MARDRGAGLAAWLLLLCSQGWASVPSSPGAPVRPAAALAAAPAIVRPVRHDASISRTLLVVEGARVSHFAKLQTLSVSEVLPLDADRNGLVTDAELQAVREELVAYVVAHYVLRPVSESGAGPALPATAIVVRLVTEDQDALAFSQWIELELERDAPAPFSRLEVQMSLFLESSPGHRDRLDALWVDEQRRDEQGLAGPRWSEELWAGRPRLLLDSGRRTPLEMLGEAWSRARGRPELAGCLLLLLLACGSWRAVGGALLCWLGACVVVGFVSRDLLGGLPALPLAVFLALMALGGVALTRPRQRPVRLEALVVGLLAGFALQSGTPGAPGEVDPHLIRLLATLALVAAPTLVWALMRRLPGRRENRGARHRGVPSWAPRWIGAAAVMAGSAGAWPLVAAALG